MKDGISDGAIDRSKGLGGEKKLVVEGEGRVRVEYHLAEPVRRSRKETEE
jgi:hypothetical protein